ncbi:MAG: hypothetical protein K2W97_01265 [Chthoniobacterales bacterium]|nr:hypothetical protein [Chthoniobacterales bacterium]
MSPLNQAKIGGSLDPNFTSGETTRSSALSTGSVDEHRVDLVDSGTADGARSILGSSCSVPSHYDPLHPVVLANTVVSETLIYATLVQDAFQLPMENCIAAGIVANVACALATSPYVSSKMMALLPNDASRSAARNFDALVRKCIDPGYVAYYTVAWPVLGVATIPEAACFILASALMRKGATLLMQSDACKGSIEQQAQALASTDQVLQPSLMALLRVMREFTPDLVASLSRSGINNLYGAHEKGKISAKDVINQTLFSGAIYIAATFLYYACYRALEQVGGRSTGMYQKPADIDQEKAQQLKADLTTFDPSSSSTLQEHDLVSQEDKIPLVKSSTAVPLALARAKAQALSKTFEVLKSPLVNLFKDPFYRSFIELTYQYRQDPDSRNAIEAFRAIDTADLLNKVVASLDSDSVAEEQIAAYKTLLGHLGVHINSGENSPEEIQVAQERGLDALIKMFQTHAFSRPAYSEGRPSLLGAAQGAGHSYGAIRSDAV